MPEVICPENGLKCHGIPTCPFDETDDCEVKKPPPEEDPGE